MRPAWTAWALAFVGFVLFPASEIGGAVLAAAGFSLLPVLGYRDGSWRAVGWTLLVPAAAVAADVVTFTPWSLQPETDAVIYTVVALYYLPLWLLLVTAGIAARRLRTPRAAAD